MIEYTIEYTLYISKPKVEKPKPLVFKQKKAKKTKKAKVTNWLVCWPVDLLIVEI